MYVRIGTTLEIALVADLIGATKPEDEEDVMTGKRQNTLAALLATTLSLGLAWQAQAQTANYLSKDATRCEIFRSLSKVVPSDCASEEEQEGLTRGLVIHDGTQARPAAVLQKNPPKDLAIAMRIEFEFDSYILTAEAKQALGQVAAVLNDDLMRDKAILIEGHADASGSDAYNMVLSRNRARAVHAYLVQAQNVDGSRLAFDGRGESQLYDLQNPTSQVNRRAEFRNLSD